MGPSMVQKAEASSVWSIYEVTSYDDLVRGLLLKMQSKFKRPLSVRALARQLGQKSPAAIHAMQGGKRLLSTEVQNHLCEKLELSSQEAAYLRAWVSYERRRRSNSEDGDELSRLARLNPRKATQSLLRSEIYSYIASWYHLPLKALVSAPDFKFNLEWIEKRLKNKLSAAKIQNSLYLLQQLGLVKREGRNWKSTTSFTTPLDVPNAAVRLHHREMMERGIEALDEEDVSRRDMSSTTFRFNTDRMAEAKTAIEDFRQEFIRRFEAPEGKEVYQLNTQLFSHTAADSKA